MSGGSLLIAAAYSTGRGREIIVFVNLRGNENRNCNSEKIWIFMEVYSKGLGNHMELGNEEGGKDSCKFLTL